jgi:hypothetical protein
MTDAKVVAVSMSVEEAIEFIESAVIARNNGHAWETRDGELDGETYFFAYADGIHNGPRCVTCGYYFCIHCTPIDTIDKCSRE